MTKTDEMKATLTGIINRMSATLDSGFFTEEDVESLRAVREFFGLRVTAAGERTQERMLDFLGAFAVYEILMRASPETLNDVIKHFGGPEMEPGKAKAQAIAELLAVLQGAGELQPYVKRLGEATLKETTG